MAEIVVLGGCVVDLISYVERFPKPGETLIGKNFARGLGGKGANQCVMAKFLGASCALIAKLGNDSFGNEYLKNMKDYKINTDNISFSNDSHTSAASICVTDEGQNSIVYVPGAVMKLTSEDVKKAEKLIANAKILLCTYECTFDALTEALKIAKKYNVLTLLNAAPTTDLMSEELYPLADIICLNEIEAEDAVGFIISNLHEAELAVKALIEKKCSNVILTLGSKGAVFQGKSTENQFFHVPARSVQPVDSTGAGDAFTGSLAFFLAKFPILSFQKIIERSCEIATRSVLKQGTQSSFPHRTGLPDWLFTEV